jgi:uncharacterized membrane protein
MADEGGDEEIKPGQSRERAVFFTDAVFAIAMTLLVIEIPRPDAANLGAGGVSKERAFASLWHFLVSERSSFYAYVLAFFMIWVVWRQHHALMDQVTRVSGSMMGWQFPLLLLAAFLPYATTILGHSAGNPLAALLYGLVVDGLLLSGTLIAVRADRGHVLRPGVDLVRYRSNITESWIVVGYWTLSLGLVWWTPWMQIPWYLTGAVAAALTRVMNQRQVRQAAAQAEQAVESQ